MAGKSVAGNKDTLGQTRQKLKPSSAESPLGLSPSTPWPRGGLVCCIGVVLVSITLACYWPAGRFGFVPLDDPDVVSTNQMVQQGLTWPSILWACKSVVVGNWQPVTTLSHMVDCQLWGLDAGKHHLTNVLIHAANVLLLFLVLRRMTGSLGRSALVAALFGWHPMHVESVAWISERKDVLSGLFFLLTLWAYCRYVEHGRLLPDPSVARVGSAARPGRALAPQERAVQDTKARSRFRAALWYGVALGFYALGLMSKPMLVTLPFVLLLLDWWPLQRLAWPRSLASTEPAAPGSTVPLPLPSTVPALRLLWEKLPFLALSLGDCVTTFVVQKHAGAVAPLGMLPLPLRVENALTSYVVYLGQLFWPRDMAVLYPLPNSIPLWQAAAAALLLAVVTLAVVWQVRKAPCLATGWFWFIGMLVPTIGLVQVGDQSRADRYTYLPYIGLGLMLVWGVPALLQELAGRRSGANPAQSTNPPQATWSAEGLSRWQVVLALAGAAALGSCWLATRAQLGYWQDNVKLLQHTVELTRQNEAARNVLGIALAQQQRIDEAAFQFQEALRISPEHSKFRPETYNNLGRIYLQRHQLDEAVSMFSEALKFRPQFTEARLHLALAYKAKGELDKALAELKLAARLEPTDMAVQGRLAEALVKSGNGPAALAHFQALVATQPTEPAPRFILAGVYISQNRPEDAISSIREALRLAPKTPAYLDHLARLLASCPEARLRNGREAVGLAERACRLTRDQNADFLDTLSAAYAEAGRFPDAMGAVEKARTVALGSHDQEGAEAAARKLQLYRAGKPYRETAKAD